MLLRAYSTVTSASTVACCALQLLYKPFSRPGQRCDARSYSYTPYNSSVITTFSGNTSSSPAGAEGTGSSSYPSGSTSVLNTAADDQDRRGFGGRVALPAEDVLRQLVLDADKLVDLTLRAYHVGKQPSGLTMQRTVSSSPLLPAATFAWSRMDIMYVHQLLRADKNCDDTNCAQESCSMPSIIHKTPHTQDMTRV
jgi:hypothetical protein